MICDNCLKDMNGVNIVICKGCLKKEQREGDKLAISLAKAYRKITQLKEKIYGRLVGIADEDLTTAEKQIKKIVEDK